MKWIVFIKDDDRGANEIIEASTPEVAAKRAAYELGARTGETIIVEPEVPVSFSFRVKAAWVK